MTPRMVDAWCAGRPVQVAVRPSPADHRRVVCRVCGAKRTADCIDLERGGVLWTGHASRRTAAERVFGAGAP